jgi:hypothetical protein
MPTKLPPIWGDNWFINMNTLIEWCTSVKLMCDITEDDYKYYINRRAFKIENGDVRNTVLTHSPYMNDLLSYCNLGITAHNANKDVPGSYTLDAIEVSSYKNAWEKHVTQEPQSLLELKSAINTTIQSLKTFKDSFVNEDSGEYSSYSDYSDSDTNSEEDEEDLEDVNDHKTNNGKKKM